MKIKAVKVAIKNKKEIKEKYKTAFAIVKKHIDELDPMGLIEICPPDEYEFEVADIVPIAMRTKDTSELADVIIKVFKEAFSENCIERKNAIIAANRIIQELSEVNE